MLSPPNPKDCDLNSLNQVELAALKNSISAYLEKNYSTPNVQRDRRG
jgi:hypothetical protein